MGIHWYSLYLSAVAEMRNIHPRKELCSGDYRMKTLVVIYFQ